ncbi:MAG: ferritin [Thermoplasmata archaeon]
MIDKEMVESINAQINAEIYSAYLYLAMAADFADKNLAGFENWMRIQYQEEMSHAMKFYDYLQERGGRVKLSAIDEPKDEWDNPLDAFEDALEHERYVTSRIHDMVDLAEEKKDRATYNMLQWYVDEQVEEEDNAETIVEKLKMIGNDTSALMMYDQKMEERVFVDETQEEE